MSRGTTVVISTTPLDEFNALEARLDARFAALEAEFAVFEVRAENGFGRFDESGNQVSAVGQGSVVIVPTPRQPATITQRIESSDAGSQVVRTQSARGKETMGADASGRQKARKDPKRDRENVRKKGERDRLIVKQRSRR